MEKKQQVSVKIKYDLQWTYGVEIGQIKQDIEALEKLGATRIDIEADSSYDSCSIEITAYCERLETDEELNNRLARIKRVNEEVKQRELAQLKKLQGKYNL